MQHVISQLVDDPALTPVWNDGRFTWEYGVEEEAAEAAEACPSEQRTCYLFQPTASAYESRVYSLQPDAGGGCMFRDADGGAIGQCIDTPPSLESRTCSNGDVIRQEYDAKGAPVWTTECERCDPEPFYCERFRPTNTLARGEWTCELVQKRYADSDGLCVHRYADGTPFSPDECLDNGCCGEDGQLCEGRDDTLHGFHRRTADFGPRNVIPEHVAKEGNYFLEEHVYYPRYRLDHRTPLPIGIELVPESPGLLPIDVTSGGGVEELSARACPPGSESVAADHAVCAPCDLRTKYYDPLTRTCAPLEGCPDPYVRYDGTAPVDGTEVNEFGHEYRTSPSEPVCVPCPPNHVASSAAEHESECAPCGDNADPEDRRYLFHNNTPLCVECPARDRLRVEPSSGLRTCEACPPYTGHAVRFDRAADACVVECAEGTFGGGAMRADGHYPKCVAFCGENERLESDECVPCDPGTFSTVPSHSNVQCETCSDGFFRSGGECVKCPHHTYMDAHGVLARARGRSEPGAYASTQCYVRCLHDDAKVFFDGSKYDVVAGCPASLYNTTQCGGGRVVAAKRPGSVYARQALERRHVFTDQECAYEGEDATAPLFSDVLRAFYAMDPERRDRLQLHVDADGMEHICAANTRLRADGRCECVPGTSAPPGPVAEGDDFDSIGPACEPAS